MVASAIISFNNADAQSWREFSYNNASDTFTVPEDWPYTPADLKPGEQFRLMFAESLITLPLSDGITNFNLLTVFNLNNVIIFADHSYHTHFKALINTRDTSIWDNTDTGYDYSGQGPPIYWVNGDRVADDYADFYDGDWPHNDHSVKKADGSTQLFSKYYTGTYDRNTGRADGHLVMQGTFATGMGGFPFDSRSPVVGCGYSSGLAETYCYRTGTRVGYLAISPVFVVPGDKQPLPDIRITAHNGLMHTEGGSITVRITSSTTAPVDVLLYIEQDGVIDATAHPEGFITIRTTGTTTDYTISLPNDDINVDNNHTMNIRVALVPQNHYTISGQTELVYDISDNDTDIIRIVPIPSTGHTIDGNTITITLQEGSDTMQTVSFKLSANPIHRVPPHGVSVERPESIDMYVVLPDSIRTDINGNPVELDNDRLICMDYFLD